MITNDIRTVYHQAKWALVLRGIISIAVGSFIIARPLESVAALALVIALWSLVDGFISIVHAFELRVVAPQWWVLLLAGVIGVLFGGAALYYYPGLSLSFAVIWTAMWLTTAGVIAVYSSVQQRSIGAPWGWNLAFGLMAIAGGVLAFMYPGATLASLMGVLSAFGVLGGCALLVGALRMQSLETDVKGAVRNPARA